jgi:glucuronosyltransferase
MGKFVLIPKMEDGAKEFFSPSTFPGLEELERNMSLIIYNNHFSLNGARPLVPGVIEAGGMHIKPKKEPLPQVCINFNTFFASNHSIFYAFIECQDLQEFMDGAKDGVIYFSMGTVIQGSQIPKVKMDALLSAFAELPQRVIFKWEQDSMPGKPSNVKIGKYLPQQSILGNKETL